MIDQFERQGAKRSSKISATTFYKNVFKDNLLYMNGWLSNVRTVHTYVMIRTVHFNWICTFQNLMLFAANQRDHLLLYSQDTSCDYDIFALSLYYVIQKFFIERDRRTNNKYSVVDFWDILFQVDRRSMILKNFSTKRQKWPYRFFVSYEGWVILVNQCMKIEKISNFCSKQSHPSISKRKSPAHTVRGPLVWNTMSSILTPYKMQHQSYQRYSRKMVHKYFKRSKEQFLLQKDNIWKLWRCIFFRVWRTLLRKIRKKLREKGENTNGMHGQIFVEMI